MTPIRLYDLAASGRRFSPYCWRARLSLARKGLPYETVPVAFTEIPTILDGQQKTVPVIDDGGRIVRDSWAIAEHLEATYPDRPALFGGEAGRAACRFAESWANSILPLIGPIVLMDIHALLAPADQAHFRRTRETRFGRPLEEVVAGREARVAPLREALTPLRLTLRAQPFVGGTEPNYGDFAVWGSLRWPLTVATIEILAADDPVLVWYRAVAEAVGLAGEA